MSSSRLRGKTLKMINGTPLLEMCTNRVKMANKVTKIVVATSRHKSDDAILNYCRKKKIFCFRGSLNNVYQRYCDVIKATKSKAFVRICADSPFIDPFLLDKFITIFKNSNVDLVTNIFPRSFPKGQSIEIFKSKIFLGEKQKIIRREDREHVTPYFYENYAKFKIKNISYNKNLSKINLCVDYKKDLFVANSIARRIDILKKKKKTDLSQIVKIAKNL